MAVQIAVSCVEQREQSEGLIKAQKWGRMLACRTEWTYGATSEIEMEHGSAESRWRFGLRQAAQAAGAIRDLYQREMQAKMSLH